ncbi:unnamed protein product [Malus baccata var. baccata]
MVCILCISSTACAQEYKPLEGDPKAMRQRYQRWQDKYGRKYKSEEEKAYRFGIYKSNLEFVDFINSQNLSYKLSDNKFADITNIEFTTNYMGFQTRRDLKMRFSYDKEEDLPTTVDWRKHGAVTPIKEQGKCEFEKKVVKKETGKPNYKLSIIFQKEKRNFVSGKEK